MIEAYVPITKPSNASSEARVLLARPLIQAATQQPTTIATGNDTSRANLPPSR